MMQDSLSGIFLMENIQSLQTLLFLFSSIILMIFIHLKFPFYLRTKKNLPPSPRKLPIIGNLHQLGSCPHRSLHALSQKHGPLMLLHFGSVATLVASSAKAAQEILKTHDLSFCSRPNIKILNIMLYGCKDIGFSPYGEYWRQLKSVAVLHLLSNTRVKSFQKVREQELGLVIGMLEKSSGSLVDVSALLFSFSNRITCKVAMGTTYDGSKLIQLLNKFLDILIVFSVGSFIPWLGWVDRLSGLVGRAEKIAKEFDEFLESIIEEHVNNRRGDGSRSQEGQNFIDILLDVQKDKTMGFTFHRDSIKALILSCSCLRNTVDLTQT
ncbi:cytochrome P450 [Artemisia annua]|uniref:Cytochrome P450 n=1 Tax=Artemisia annua TaxID=35608 RepID=A0A2U1KCI7_ARTAN|nr:cytochrome P450 [Artemisia annua]